MDPGNTDPGNPAAPGKVNSGKAAPGKVDPGNPAAPGKVDPGKADPGKAAPGNPAYPGNPAPGNLVVFEPRRHRRRVLNGEFAFAEKVLLFVFFRQHTLQGTGAGFCFSAQAR